MPGMCVADVRTHLGAAGNPPEQVEALLRAHGVSGADAVVPIDVCWRIFTEHAAHSDDELHGVFGSRLRPGGANLLIARMLLCPTIHDALCAYADATAVFVPELTVTVTRRRDGVSLRWRSREPDNSLHQIVLEGVAAAYFAIFCWMAGRPLPVARVRSAAARRDSGTTLLDLMGAPVVHAGEEVEIVFTTEAAQAPIGQADFASWREGAYRMLSELALRPRSAAGGGAFSDQVRTALMDGVDQETLARRWGVSAKTVARRLEQEGSSFRRIRGEVRMQSSTCLIHAGLTVEQIGEMLGYEDSRSFRRAFRRWFGVSPSAYRSRPAAA